MLHDIWRSKISWGEEIDEQLHILVDVSKDCSAAVGYLRIHSGELVTCSFVLVKSKVTPLTLTSMPRLELIAALLVARILKELTLKPAKVTYWTDSKTVLYWLQSYAKDVKEQFTQFRIA